MVSPGAESQTTSPSSISLLTEYSATAVGGVSHDGEDGYRHGAQTRAIFRPNPSSRSLAFRLLSHRRLVGTPCLPAASPDLPSRAPLVLADAAIPDPRQEGIQEKRASERQEDEDLI